MNDDTRRAMFDELMELSGVTLQQERHFTVAEFAETQGLSHQAAGRILVALHKQGNVGREKVVTVEGRQAWGYWVA